ncbi:MAG: ACP S-malonyltransferase, partial [Thermoanaerobaculia bacterium]
MSLALLFPGQGSQFVGMGKDLYEFSPPARAVFDEADVVLGFPLSKLCFEGPEEELKLTANTQPAILAHSVAAWRDLEARLPEKVEGAAFAAGHSLGEYSANVASGALPFAVAVALVRSRGRFMQEAVPPGVGGMAAILGLPAAEVEAACREAAQGEV